MTKKYERSLTHALRRLSRHEAIVFQPVKTNELVQWCEERSTSAAERVHPSSITSMPFSRSDGSGTKVE